jgi:hypothetical protein
MRLPTSSEAVIYCAALIIAALVSVSYVKTANCKIDGGFWLNGECNYGLESGGSVEKVRSE